MGVESVVMNVEAKLAEFERVLERGTHVGCLCKLCVNLASSVSWHRVIL